MSLVVIETPSVVGCAGINMNCGKLCNLRENSPFFAPRLHGHDSAC